jgi:hypothetical protein
VANVNSVQDADEDAYSDWKLAPLGRVECPAFLVRFVAVSVAQATHPLRKVHDDVMMLLTHSASMR